MLIAICSVVSFILGYILAKLYKKEKPVGTLRIDQSDPEDGPYLFLELSTDPRALMAKKTVIFDVNTESYITQK